MLTAGPTSPRRRAAVALLVAGVTLAHWLLGLELGESRLGDGAADRAPQAIEVAFVQELTPSVPPLAAASPRPAPTRVVAAAPAASAAGAQPEPAQVPPEPPPPAPTEPADPAQPPANIASTDPAPEPPGAVEPASAPEALAATAQASAPPGPAASGPVAAASSVPVSASPPPNAAAVHFDWPPSTRLSYRLEGQYRGPLYGTARVEWLRQGQHYQVRLTVEVAPVFSRRMLSDGVLGPQGLAPRRYDEETEVTLRGIRRNTVLFQPDQILLANGKTSEPAPGVQDAASQFVQLSWLFLTRPELLKVGQRIEFPLALPRRVGRWAYEVTERVMLRLPFGEVETYRLQPQPGSRKGNELSVEMWVAPSLQYLPVRIALQQDAETHLELNLESRPLQAAPPP